MPSSEDQHVIYDDTKTIKTFLEQYNLLNSEPQTISTDKEAAFTGHEYRS